MHTCTRSSVQHSCSTLLADGPVSEAENGVLIVTFSPPPASDHGSCCVHVMLRGVYGWGRAKMLP